MAGHSLTKVKGAVPRCALSLYVMLYRTSDQVILYKRILLSGKTLGLETIVIPGATDVAIE